MRIYLNLQVAGNELPMRHQQNTRTAPAEAHLRYICTLTSRYADWLSQPEQGRTQRDCDRRRRVQPTRRQGDGATRLAKLRASCGSWPSQDAAGGSTDSAARCSAL